MSVIFKERPQSRKFSKKDQTIETSWVGMGLFTRLAADTVAYYSSPIQLEGLWRQDIQGDPKGNGVWNYTIPYGPLPKAPGSFSFSFDTTGNEQTIRIAVLDKQVTKYKAGTAGPYTGSDVPDRHVLNVDENKRVQGIPIYVPATRLSYKFRHPMGVVTEAMSRILTSYTGCGNSAAWHGYVAGSLLFIGTQGAQGTDSEAELTYNFLYSEPLVNATVGGLSGVNKDGWDYLDVAWKKDATGGVDSVTAEAAWVQRVYRRINYGTSFGY